MPREGVNSQMLIPAITKPVKLVEKDDLLKNIEPKVGDVWVTLGAGDIDAFVQPIKNAFFEHYKQL